MTRFLVPVFLDNEDRETVPQEGDIIRYNHDQGSYGLVRKGVPLQCRNPDGQEAWVWTPASLSLEEPVREIARQSQLRLVRIPPDTEGRLQWQLM